tara:strand:+ start:5883 stop:7103 length:1221 start_codon:yes stop_codon:yes gene_type:complete
MTDPLLQLKGVSIRRGTETVLSDFSLSISGGECVVLNGENGSGKSTVIETSARLLPMEKGKIFQYGKLVYDFEGRSKKPISPFGLTLQSNCLVPSQTIHQHLETVCKISQSDFDFLPILELYGLSHRKHDKIAYLSGGQQRKVSVISGLIPAMVSNEPRLVILDEPDSGLDDRSIEVLIDHINQLRNSGNAILIATHDNRLFKCATKLNNLTEEVEQKPTGSGTWELHGTPSPNRFLSIKTGWQYNFSTLANIQRNWLAALLLIGGLLSLVEPLSIAEHKVLLVGFTLAPALTIGLVGDPVVSMMFEQRAIDWWRSQVQIIPNSSIESFLSGCILTLFSMQIFLENVEWSLVLIGGVIALITTIFVSFLQLSTIRLARSNAVYIRLLTPILILPWALIVDYCATLV